ncbi:MAG TPA: hypothetical protein VIK08_10705 [Candidatus Limnocylindrales bacterium]
MVGAPLAFVCAQRSVRVSLPLEAVEERRAGTLGDLTGIVGRV